MRRVSIWLVLLFLVSICSGYLVYSNQKTVTPHTITASQIRAAQVSLPRRHTPEILKVPPVDMPKVLSESYRLGPDKRFLLSLQEVYQFFSKQNNKKVSSQFLDGKWVVLFQEQEVGRLPEFPEFSDFLTLISKWSKELNKEFPQNLASQTSPENFSDISQDLSRFLVPHTAMGLQKINSRWEQGNRDPYLLKLAAQSLVRISLQVSNQLELSDPVHAKALAFLGIAQSLTAFPMKREEGLLAWTMDYSGHSERASRSLDQSDPIRMLIMKQDSSLEKHARSENSSTEVKFLWLVRLAKKRQMKDWYEWVMTAFGDNPLPLSVLKTGLEMKSFVGSQHFTGKMQQIAIQELRPEQNNILDQYKPVKVVKTILVNNKYYQLINHILGFGPTARKRIAQLESELKNVDKKYSGPFLDAKIFRSYYRGHFYSSLFVEGSHYLDTLSDINGARRFAGNMQGRLKSLDKKYQSFKNNIGSFYFSKPVSNDSVNTPFGIHYTDSPNVSNASNELVDWYDHLVSAREGRKNLDELKSDLLDIRDLGIPALYKTYQSLIVNYSLSDPSILRTIKQFASRMDSRNQHKRMLGNIAVGNLSDLKLGEKLYRSVESSSPSNYADILIVNGYRSRDDKQLFTHLQSSHLSSDDKSDILFQLYFLSPESHPLIEKEYQRLLKFDSEDYGLTIGYAGFLMKKKKFEKARKLIRDWQNLELVTPGLERINAQTAYARSYYKEGQYEEALTEIAKVVEGQKGSSLELAGKILNKLNRLEDAEEIFRFNAERYSSHIGSLMPLIKFLWEHDRGLEAAKLLKGFNRPISGDDLKKKIAKPFSEIFGSQPVEKGEQAFSQLIKAGMNPRELMGISPVVFKNGNAELAFKMQSQLRLGGKGQLLIYFKTYPYIKTWQGEEKALEWLKKVIPPQAVPHSSDIILYTQEFDLLWSFITAPDEYAWLTRASGYSSDKNLSEKNKTKLFEYFKSPNKNPHYHIIGQYMLGMVTEPELLNAADTPKKRCEYAYFIGFKAQMEGNYEKASDWYRIVIETGQAYNGEYFMAVNQLTEWTNKFHYLSKLGTVDS